MPMETDPERVESLLRHLAGHRVCPECAEVFLELLDDIRAEREGCCLDGAATADRPAGGP